MTFVLIEGEQRTEFEDGVRAVMAYSDLVTHGRPCTLLDEGLPGVPSVIIADYVGSSMSRRPETEGERNVREGSENRYLAAYWYARGFIECIGGLSPFDALDAITFAHHHKRVAAEPGNHPIAESWAVWSAQRRAETGL